MSLIRWEPYNEMNEFRNMIDRMGRDFFRFGHYPFWRHFGPGLDRFGPRIDVYQTDKEVVVTAELPGVQSKDDIKVNVGEESLNMRGEVKRTSEQKDDNFYHNERFYGTFSRTVPLPSPVKPKEARASYKNGILEVRIPKAKTTEYAPVDVEIQ